MILFLGPVKIKKKSHKFAVLNWRTNTYGLVFSRDFKISALIGMLAKATRFSMCDISPCNISTTTENQHRCDAHLI